MPSLTLEVDGIPKSETRGRLDVLLVLADTHWAVLKLKKPELELTEDDGLTYLSPFVVEFGPARKVGVYVR